MSSLTASTPVSLESEMLVFGDQIFKLLVGLTSDPLRPIVRGLLTIFHSIDSGFAVLFDGLSSNLEYGTSIEFCLKDLL